MENYTDGQMIAAAHEIANGEDGQSAQDARDALAALVADGYYASLAELMASTRAGGAW